MLDVMKGTFPLTNAIVARPGEGLPAEYLKSFEPSSRHELQLVSEYSRDISEATIFARVRNPGHPAKAVVAAGRSITLVTDVPCVFVLDGHIHSWDRETFQLRVANG
jgi:hypothetical protein